MHCKIWPSKKGKTVPSRSAVLEDGNAFGSMTTAAGFGGKVSVDASSECVNSAFGTDITGKGGAICSLFAAIAESNSSKSSRPSMV